MHKLKHSARSFMGTLGHTEKTLTVGQEGDLRVTLQVNGRLTEGMGRRDGLVVLTHDGEHPQMLNLGEGHSL